MEINGINSARNGIELKRNKPETKTEHKTSCASAQEAAAGYGKAMINMNTVSFGQGTLSSDSPEKTNNSDDDNISFVSSTPLYKRDEDKKSVIISVKTGKDVYSDLEVDEHLTKTYLSGVNGDISEEKVKVLKTVYETEYQKLLKEHTGLMLVTGNISNWQNPEDFKLSEEDIILSDADDIKDDLRQQLEDFDKTKSVLLKELPKSESGIDFTYSVLKGIPEGKFKQALASQLLKSESSVSKEELMSKALAKTLTLLSLSRTDDGYDLSNSDEKQDLAIRIEHAQWNTGESGLAETLASISSEQKGKIDLNYISALCKIYDSQEIMVPLSEIVEKTGEIIKRDSDNEQAILDFLSDITEEIKLHDEYFDEYADLCFNPVTGKYDKNALPVLKEIYVEADIIAGDMIEKSEKDWDDAYSESEKFKIDTVRSYFSLIRYEKTGEIRNDAQSVEDFCNNIEF